MAEEATEQVPQAPETPQEPPQERTVPYDRFAEVNQKAKNDAAELVATKQRLQELEDAGKSETEKERARADRVEAENQGLQVRLVKAERGAWVRGAANGFEDPSDAVALIDLSEVESEKDAERAVKKLAERKPHLLKQENNVPQIGQVVSGGRPSGQGVLSAADEENERLLAAIKTKSEQSWQSSTPLFPDQ